MTTRLEHANITVTDAERTAAMLVDLFDWTIRWKGESKLGGRSIHVGAPGTDNDYLAIYTTPEPPTDWASPIDIGGLNHLGLVVDDLDEVERRVIAAGLTVTSRDEYDPGRRFYFDDHDGIEFEVVSYS